MSPDRISRRGFLATGAAAAGALAADQLLGQPSGQSTSSRRVLHIIGYSHIDAAWQWPWRDGCNLALTTARSALDRITETPGFRYTHSSSIHYRWIQGADPAMFQEIRQRIREGRWEVVGAWPVEPDCNMPSTEAFVRHSLYGKRYCRRELGVDVKIGFNPDSFGHAAGLPTILKHSGYNYYVFMRPAPSDEPNSIPHLFWWEGPDGSRVLTLKIYGPYDGPASRIPDAAAHGFAPGFNHAAFFLGVGDHGGAVTKAQIAQVLQMRNDPTLPELRWSTVAEFFRAVEASPALANLPVIRGGLQHSARGCYSANGEMKYNNRRAERSMIEAESLALLTHLTLNRDYPRAEFESAWWNVLFNQFHDLLAGSAIYSDYEQARDQLGSACATAQAVKIEALESIARRVDTSQAVAGVVFAFNPLPWRRTAYLEYIPGGNARSITHLKAHDGTKVPIQLRHAESMSRGFQRLAAWVDLPPFGYRVLSEEDDTPPAAPAYESFSTLNENGFGLSSLKAPGGAELLAAPLGLVVIEDTSDTWAHRIDSFRKEIGRPTFVSSTVVDDGPVLRVSRQRFRWQQSEIVVDVATFPGQNIIRFHFVIDWHEHQQMLMFELPTALANSRIRAMVPGAVTTTPANGNEDPYQDWIALEGQVQGSDHTLGLLNNSTYSYDCLGNLLRAVLVRSAPYVIDYNTPIDPDSTDAWQDQGRQERIFWLTARRGLCAEQAFDQLANELQSPAEYIMDSRHPGTEPWEKSFLTLAPNTVSILAMKRAEDMPGAVIVRVQERTGAATVMRIESSLLGLKQNVPLRPWEIKTLRIMSAKQGKAQVSIVSGLEV
jgi:alpha-mannosidase